MEGPLINSRPQLRVTQPMGNQLASCCVLGGDMYGGSAGCDTGIRMAFPSWEGIMLQLRYGNEDEPESVKCHLSKPVEQQYKHDDTALSTFQTAR